MTATPLRLTQFARGGGCSCKIPPAELEVMVAGLFENHHATGADLIVGLEHGDDAGVLRMPDGNGLVMTADFFGPVVDDPYDWGRIAACNALSDVYAMGGTPLSAVNLLGWPRATLSLDIAREVLRGGLDVAGLAGCPVIGGHSIDDAEPKFGMAVTGIVKPEHIISLDAGAPGLPLSLSKPLGTGVLNSRHKATGEAFPEAVEVMTRLNRDSSQAAVRAGIRCGTDVTGFGLLGHAFKLARASNLTAVIDSSAVPYLDGARESAAAGHVSGGTRRNLDWVRPHTDAGRQDELELLLLADAQTSGGLLLAGEIPGGTVIGELVASADRLTDHSVDASFDRRLPRITSIHRRLQAVTSNAPDISGVIHDVVAPNAAKVDASGAFPDESIEALRSAGLLGLVSSREVGGSGADMAQAAAVIEQLSGACGSTAMILLMHYAAVAVYEAHGPEPLRREIAAGNHLTTLAFSERGSRSHFWSPVGSAVRDGAAVRLNAEKSFVTAASRADSYVWSSLPMDAAGAMTLWSVPRATHGLQPADPFDGLGLRGNDSRPVSATDATVSVDSMLGADGAGLDIALGAALPWFLILNSAFCVGQSEAALASAVQHLTHTRLSHLDASMAEQPVPRQKIASARLALDGVRGMLADTLAALGEGRDDATLRLLGMKAAAAEVACEVTDVAMQVCGGSAFRKELGIERRFRDSRAARVMAPTTEALLDFVGRLMCGLPLFDPAPKKAS